MRWEGGGWKLTGMNEPARQGWGYWIGVLGPGLLMAGAAIGVSHLVQSTRAGAEYGWDLVLLVVLVNVFKMPFFEFGHRYAAATGRNLLDGYRELGVGWLWLFLVLNVVSAVIATAGVTIVLAGLTAHLFPGLDTRGWSAVALVASMGLIVLGRYRWLDGLMKGVMVVLFVTTLAALAAAFWHGPVAAADYRGPSPWELSQAGFLLALMGWMPAPIELSVWQSLWIQAKNRSRAQPLTEHEARVDFHVGYWMTTVSAVIFLMLGALMMFGSGTVFSQNGAVFAAQFVEIYRKTLGSWAGPVVTLAAISTMFSTVLTVVDAYPRSLAVGVETAWGRVPFGWGKRMFHGVWMVLVGVVAWVLITHFTSNMKGMVDLATIIAFLSAPVFAWINFLVVTGPGMPEGSRPGRGMRGLAWAGLVFLAGFSVWYALSRVM